MTGLCTSAYVLGSSPIYTHDVSHIQCVKHIVSCGRKNLIFSRFGSVTSDWTTDCLRITILDTNTQVLELHTLDTNSVKSIHHNMTFKITIQILSSKNNFITKSMLIPYQLTLTISN